MTELSVSNTTGRLELAPMVNDNAPVVVVFPFDVVASEDSEWH